MLAALVFQYPQALPWVIGLEIVLTSMILLIYPRQLRRRWRWALRGLRILAVTAIAFSILRPVLTRPRFASERAPIVILLDNSRSMSVIDTGRPPAEWVGIAAAMRLLPPDALDKEIDAVQAACDRLSTQADELTRARAELEYARLSDRGSDIAQARLDQATRDLQSIAHDAAAKATVLTHANQLEKTLAYLEQIPIGMDRQTWLDHVRDKARAAAMNAEQLRTASDAGLYRTNQTIREACLALQSRSRLQLAEDAVHQLAAQMGDTSFLKFGISDKVVPDTTGVLVADGTFSNLTGGVRAVLETFQSAPPRAVVFFSDGRQIGGDSDAIPQGVPVYTVGLAARAGKATSNPKPSTKPVVDPEMIDLSGDEGRLRRLAESSGGEFFRMDQVDLLPKKLDAIADDLGHPIEISLWDGPFLFCLVLGCLAAEWGLRKKLGLA